MKKVEKPQGGVGKGERGEIWIHLKEKYMFTIFITNQDSSVNYKSVLLTLQWLLANSIIDQLCLCIFLP